MHNAAINGRSNPYGHTVRASSDPYANGYTHIATPQGMPTPEATEPWSAPMSVTMPSTVSSPASCGPAEDYRYMPTPVSAPLIDPSSLPPTSVPFQNQDVEYDSVDSGKNRPTQATRQPCDIPMSFFFFFFPFPHELAGLELTRNAENRAQLPQAQLQPTPHLCVAVLLNSSPASTLELHDDRSLRSRLPQQPFNVR